MSRVNAFLVLILAFSSICFGASLMQRSMAKTGDHITSLTVSLNGENFEQSCQQLIKLHQKQAATKIAEELYKEAFSLNFDGDWQGANAASECAAYLTNGSDHWNYEAKDLIK